MIIESDAMLRRSCAFVAGIGKKAVYYFITELDLKLIDSISLYLKVSKDQIAIVCSMGSWTPNIHFLTNNNGTSDCQTPV